MAKHPDSDRGFMTATDQLEKLGIASPRKQSLRGAQSDNMTVMSSLSTSTTLAPKGHTNEVADLSSGHSKRMDKLKDFELYHSGHPPHIDVRAYVGALGLSRDVTEFKTSVLRQKKKELDEVRQTLKSAMERRNQIQRDADFWHGQVVELNKSWEVHGPINTLTTELCKARLAEEQDEEAIQNLDKKLDELCNRHSIPRVWTPEFLPKFRKWISEMEEMYRDSEWFEHIPGEQFRKLMANSKMEAGVSYRAMQALLDHVDHVGDIANYHKRLKDPVEDRKKNERVLSLNIANKSYHEASLALSEYMETETASELNDKEDYDEDIALLDDEIAKLEKEIQSVR